MKMKVCSLCKLNKCESDFRLMKGKTKTQSSYLCSLCKLCERQKALERYRINKIVSWLEFNMCDDIKWYNYGKVWQIDHTIPINLWNMQHEGEMLLCFSWMNLMPMIKEMNNKKSNKLLLWRIWHQERMLRAFSIHNPSLKESIYTFIQNYTCKVKYLYTQHA